MLHWANNLIQNIETGNFILKLYEKNKVSCFYILYHNEEVFFFLYEAKYILFHFLEIYLSNTLSKH